MFAHLGCANKLVFLTHAIFYSDGLQLKDLFLVMIQLPTILLDINKVIDSVPHDLLLEQIWKCGLTGSLWWLFHSYTSLIVVSVSGWRVSCLVGFQSAQGSRREAF